MIERDTRLTPEEDDKVLKAFNAVLNCHFDLCTSNSKNFSPRGINLFVFKTQEECDNSPNNCKYNYVVDKSDLWYNLVRAYDSENEIEQKFDVNKHFLVCVLLPSLKDENNQNFLGEMRMIDYNLKNELIRNKIYADKEDN